MYYSARQHKVVFTHGDVCFWNKCYSESLETEALAPAGAMSGSGRTHCESVCLLIWLDLHVIGWLLHRELLQRLRLQLLWGQNNAMTTACAKHVLMLRRRLPSPPFHIPLQRWDWLSTPCVKS